MMADYLALDAATVEAQIDALLVSYPELAEDDELRADMLEGETELNRIVARALDRKLDADMMIAGIKARKANLGERQAREERRSEAMRELIRRLMAKAGVDRLVLPDATISLTPPRETVSILDLDELPQGFVRVKREADKIAIGNALKAGEDVPGAALCIGPASISVRTK